MELLVPLTIACVVLDATGRAKGKTISYCYCIAPCKFQTFKLLTHSQSTSKSTEREKKKFQLNFKVSSCICDDDDEKFTQRNEWFEEWERQGKNTPKNPNLNTEFFSKKCEEIKVNEISAAIYSARIYIELFDLCCCFSALSDVMIRFEIIQTFIF